MELRGPRPTPAYALPPPDATTARRFDVEACKEWEFGWVFQRVWVSFLFMFAYFGFWEVTLYQVSFDLLVDLHPLLEAEEK